MTELEFNGEAIDAFTCTSSGWELTKRNYGMYIGIGLVAGIIQAIPLVGLLLYGPLEVGIFSTYLRDMRNEPVSFGMMFSGFNKFGPAFLVGLVAMVPTIIFEAIRWSSELARLVGVSGTVTASGEFGPFGLSGMFLYLGVYLVLNLVWYIGVFFVFPLVAETELGPAEALKLSLQAALANFGSIFLLMLLEAGIIILGVLACGIGIIFAYPVVHAANAFAFRQAFPYGGRPFDNLPPNPQAFGSDYGQGM